MEISEEISPTGYFIFLYENHVIHSNHISLSIEGGYEGNTNNRIDHGKIEQKASMMYMD